jgi:hypothetical protein
MTKEQKLYKSFYVSSICRVDLITDKRTEKFVLGISNSDMKNIASHMGDTMQDDFWDALEYAIEHCLENKSTK